METFMYIFAFGLGMAGLGFLVRGFVGTNSGMMMGIGFCFLIGGITVFNNIKEEKSQVTAGLSSSIEHEVINEDMYAQEQRYEEMGYTDQENGQVDFSESNKKQEARLNEIRQQNAEIKRREIQEAERNFASMYGNEDEE